MLEVRRHEFETMNEIYMCVCVCVQTNPHWLEVMLWKKAYLLPYRGRVTYFAMMGLPP